jgi:hypothetical protein
MTAHLPTEPGDVVPPVAAPRRKAGRFSQVYLELRLAKNHHFGKKHALPDSTTASRLAALLAIPRRPGQKRQFVCQAIAALFLTNELNSFIT